MWNQAQLEIEELASTFLLHSVTCFGLLAATRTALGSLLIDTNKLDGPIGLKIYLPLAPYS